MNKKNIDWNNYEENFRKKWAKIDLEKSKSSSISFLESQGNYASRKEVFHAHWETYLTSSDYWKNWQEKINSFQSEKEVSFYEDRLKAFIGFVEKYTCKDINNYCGLVIEGLQQWDPLKTPQLIDQELKRLENISEEEFNKTDEWRKNEPVFKELSVEEMKNDPWFSKQLGFGSENKESEERKEKESSPIIATDYQSWTQDQLITEINRLKTENEELKNNQTLTNSEKEVKLNENKQRLEQLRFIVESDNSNIQSSEQNKFPISLVIGVGALVIVGITAFLVIKNKKKEIV